MKNWAGVGTLIAASIAVATYLYRIPRLKLYSLARPNKDNRNIIEYKLSIEHHGEFSSAIRSIRLVVLSEYAFLRLLWKLYPFGGYSRFRSKELWNPSPEEKRHLESGRFHVVVYTPYPPKENDPPEESEALLKAHKDGRLAFVVRIGSKKARYSCVKREIFQHWMHPATLVNTDTKNNTFTN